MVVPIHKKWEANGARLQVLQRDKIIQLVLFFEDFSHGQCMNFNVKSTDVFESITRSGKWGTRIVDAKFALPRGPDDDSRDFVCVDMPEYPGEHDDITILFETENGQWTGMRFFPRNCRTNMSVDRSRCFSIQAPFGGQRVLV